MSTPIGTFVRALWSAFEARHVRAAVPRRYESLPDSPQGDLDIWVHPDDLKTVLGEVRAQATESGFRFLFAERVWNHHHVVLWRRPEETEARPIGLHLDLQTALGLKGFLYSPVEPFLVDPEPRNGVSIPPAAARVVALALHVLLDKTRVREDDRQALRRDVAEGLKPFAAAVLPAGAGSRLADWVLAGAPEAQVGRLVSSLRRALRRRYVLNYVRPAWVRLGRWMRYLGPRRGVLVALVGPDGAGKSTLVQAVLPWIPSGPFPVKATYMGKRDTFLPTSRLIRRLSLRNGKATAGSNVGPAPGLLRRALRRLKDAAGLANWVIEQWARYLVEVRPILQQGGVVLTDRYFFDFVQRDSPSLAHHPLVGKALCRCFARPDRTYLLWEEPEVLWRRKAEGSREAVAETLDRYRRLVRLIPGIREVRTDRPARIIAGAIAIDIAGLLESRCRL